jgi:uncharacterized protein YgiM (DUF1202 family)
MIVLIGCSSANNSNASTPEPSSIPITPVNEAGTIKVETARLRALPDVTSQQIGTLNRGSRVMVIGISSDGNWYLVRATGLQKDAWVAVEFVGLGTLPPAKTATESGSATSSTATSSEITPVLTGTPTSTPTATSPSSSTATRKPRSANTPTASTSTPTPSAVTPSTATPTTEPATPTPTVPTDTPTPTEPSYP